MNPEVRVKAEALAEALAQSDEYKALKEAREELERHEAAKIMLRDFRRKQEALERKMLAGHAPSEEELQEIQQAYQIVALNPYVRKVIEAEVAFAATLAEVQRILAAAAGIELPDRLPGAAADASAGQGSSLRSDRDEQGGSARSRLWVPGR